jgi:hypothetical protein
MSHSVRVFPSREALAQSFAAMLIRDLDRIEPDHYYTIALSGVPRPNLYSATCLRITPKG